jgi:CBS domain-containing protein
MKTIGQILKEKGSDTWHVTPETLVFDALKLLAEKDVGALLVMRKGKVAGIFSERDYARKVILKGKSSKKIPVSEIMSTQVIFITPDQSCEKGLALMTTAHVRHLPVFEGEALIGIVSIGDLVNAVMSEQKQVIDKLEQHILENLSLT